MIKKWNYLPTYLILNKKNNSIDENVEAEIAKRKVLFQNL